MAKKNNTKAFTSIDNINMRVNNASIQIRQLIEGYENNTDDEGGVTSMNGRLNIRPRYQRLYIADLQPMWRENLINSIICGFPINRIYIGVVDGDLSGRLEMLDGQQRTITICDFVKGKFSIIINGEPFMFHNLSLEKQAAILNYNLDITYCDGTEEARIAWFKRINQPNSILTPQELRNATYVGTWLECAKRYFSATSSNVRKQVTDKTEKYCLSKYAGGRSIERSEYLELAIDWIAYDKYEDLRGKCDEDERIMRYMSEHQHDENADELINHYKNVIDWVNDVFFHNGFEPNEKKWQNIRNQDWGRLYAEYKDKELTENEKIHITETSKRIVSYGAAIYQTSYGIYEWVLRGEKDEEKKDYLKLRNFSDEDKMARYNAQGGIDPINKQHYEYDEMECHHIVPRLCGGDNKYDNCIMLSQETHKLIHAGGYVATSEELKNLRDFVCKNKK